MSATSTVLYRLRKDGPHHCAGSYPRGFPGLPEQIRQVRGIAVGHAVGNQQHAVGTHPTEMHGEVGSAIADVNDQQAGGHVRARRQRHDSGAHWSPHRRRKARATVLRRHVQERDRLLGGLECGSLCPNTECQIRGVGEVAGKDDTELSRLDEPIGRLHFAA